MGWLERSGLVMTGHRKLADKPVSTFGIWRAQNGGVTGLEHPWSQRTSSDPTILNEVVFVGLNGICFWFWFWFCLPQGSNFFFTSQDEWFVIGDKKEVCCFWYDMNVSVWGLYTGDVLLSCLLSQRRDFPVLAHDLDFWLLGHAWLPSPSLHILCRGTGWVNLRARSLKLFHL